MPGTAPGYSDRGGQWILGWGAYVSTPANRVPNDPRYDCLAPEHRTTNFCLRSDHPGGANVGLADGSVRFLKQTINPAIMQGLGTRAGGEVVGSDQY